MSHLRRNTTTALWTLSPMSLACSGLNIQATMDGVDQLARFGVIYAGILVVVALLLRLRVAFAVCLALFALHPAWTMSSHGGDCGGSKHDAVYLVGFLAMWAVAIDFVRTLRHKYPHTPEDESNYYPLEPQ